MPSTRSPSAFMCVRNPVMLRPCSFNDSSESSCSCSSRIMMRCREWCRSFIRRIDAGASFQSSTSFEYLRATSVRETKPAMLAASLIVISENSSVKVLWIGYNWRKLSSSRICYIKGNLQWWISGSGVIEIRYIGSTAACQIHRLICRFPQPDYFYVPSHLSGWIRDHHRGCVSNTACCCCVHCAPTLHFQGALSCATSCHQLSITTSKLMLSALSAKQLALGMLKTAQAPPWICVLEYPKTSIYTCVYLTAQ